MNGKAPKDPATGSQVDVTRNRQPKARIAGQDFHASAIVRDAARRTMAHTAAPTTQSNTRSPDRLFERPPVRVVSPSASAVSAPRREAAGIKPLLGRQQRLPRERDLLHSRFDLLDDRLRQRRIEKG